MAIPANSQELNIGEETRIKVVVEGAECFQPELWKSGIEQSFRESGRRFSISESDPEVFFIVSLRMEFTVGDPKFRTVDEPEGTLRTKKVKSTASCVIATCSTYDVATLSSISCYQETIREGDLSSASGGARVRSEFISNSRDEFIRLLGNKFVRHVEPKVVLVPNYKQDPMDPFPLYDKIVTEKSWEKALAWSKTGLPEKPRKFFREFAPSYTGPAANLDRKIQEYYMKALATEMRGKVSGGLNDYDDAMSIYFEMLKFTDDSSLVKACAEGIARCESNLRVIKSLALKFKD